MRWLALLLTSLFTTSTATAADRPNILFVLADDWGWGDLSCQGHDRLKTPQLDRLAQQGTRFTQYYQCSGVCSPSRAALMTGRFPSELAIHGHLATHDQNARRAMPDALDPTVPTLPRLLQKSGYRTGHYGKWHLSPHQDDPKSYGFDEYRVATGGASEWDLWKPENRPTSTREIVDETLAFINRNQQSPFFVQAWLLDTHAILNPTDDQLARYPNLKPQGVRFSNPAQVYYAAATEADAQLGRLFKGLDDLGLADNTIVIFSSDNGPEAPEIGNASHSGVGSPGPFRGRKRSLYEGGIRVPFIVRWPGHVPANHVDDSSVIAGVDFFPTIASLTQTPTPDDPARDGEDRSSALLSGQPTPRHTPLLWEWRFRIAGHVWNRSPMLVIRDDNWKLLFNPDRSRIELYDIPADPLELNNQASTHPDLVEKLATRALAWQENLPEGPTDPGTGSNTYPWPKPLNTAPASRNPAP